MIKKLFYKALASKVLAVAVVNYNDDNSLFDWAVYVDAVEGYNHELEKEAVAIVGDKQSPRLATILFPELDIKRYRE